MVRTLSFHLNNTGSNPVNLVMSKRKYLLPINLKSNNNLYIKFRFFSYFSPSNSLNSFSKRFCRAQIRLRYSYFFFLLLHQCFSNTYNSPYINPRTSVMKRRSNVLTITKAPMAHKKFSKEQFNFVYYYITLSLTASLPPKALFSRSNLFFIFYFLFRVNLVPETSSLFLKSKVVSIGSLIDFSLYDEIGRHARLKTSSL